MGEKTTDKIKVEVVKRFRNKYSKTVMSPGEVIEITESRFEQINSAGHGELVRKIEDENTDPEKEPENTKPENGPENTDPENEPEDED
ncbi:MAG: hypothetical protein QM401_04340 [Bacillota bacterium]|nr:hypothetical protein [Bacillota bacterium]